MEQINIKYVGGKEASKILGVHQRTLYQWEEKKLIETIRTPGGKRLYNVSKYLEEHSEFKNKKSDDDINNEIGEFEIPATALNQINELAILLKEE